MLEVISHLDIHLHFITNQMLVHYQDSTRRAKIQMFDEYIARATSLFITFVRQALKEHIF